MYEPKIITFLCTWCSYTGADSAGIARMKSPANIRAIRVPCSGRVSPEIIIRTFDQGADGVLVLGCHIGECHYDTGNHRTAKRLPIVQALMEFAGLEPQRLRLDWVSASEGERFARITNEFVDGVREFGPVKWRVPSREWRAAIDEVIPDRESVEFVVASDCAGKTDVIRATAKDLLASGQVGCVIGYEVGPRGRTRPAFVYRTEEVDRLIWNPDCTHNLTTYLRHKLNQVKGKEPVKPVAVIVKPCDSRVINVLVAENAFARQQVHAIGVVCEGIRDDHGGLQTRCITCTEHNPLVYDTLIGDPSTIDIQYSSPVIPGFTQLRQARPAERMEFWLSQFDRCIRCYACRQACPMCDCPTCLYESDDSTWVGMGIGVSEKRTFHLGRAFHLAGRCIGCNECERVCPMNIPIGYLNQRLAQEIEKSFGFRAGLAPVVSPIVTILAGEYKEGEMNIITQAQLAGWLDNLAQEQSLIAPTNIGGVLLYRPVEDSDDIAWGSTRPLMSVKDAFFPPTERLLTIEKIGQQIELTQTFSEGNPVIFGVRPCDAQGIQVLDALFIDTEPVDPYYARRRENATLIGLACKKMEPSCFCTSTGGAPDDTTGLDIFLTEIVDGFAIETLTEKGEALLQGLSLAEFNGELPKPRSNKPLALIEKGAWPAHFNDEYWERMSERCLSCRICAYVCPTCRCFAVRDEVLPTPGQFERIRCWDSCAGENYRRIAGGHKPRAEKSERLRNRFLCKFYYYPEQYGLDATTACTGCGRCVDACPVNIDITEVLMEIGSWS